MIIEQKETKRNKNEQKGTKTHKREQKTGKKERKIFTKNSTAENSELLKFNARTSLLPPDESKILKKISWR